MLSRVAAAVALALLAACVGVAGNTRFSGFLPTALWGTSIVGFAQAQGPVPVVVLGQPFPAAPADDLARVVAATMTGANGGPPLTFVAAPTGRDEGEFYVVVAFGTARVGALDLCRVRDPEVVPPRERVRADAAFCVGSRRITEVQGNLMVEARGPDDPAFRDFLRAVALNLIPPRNPHSSSRQFCSPVAGC